MKFIVLNTYFHPFPSKIYLIDCLLSGCKFSIYATNSFFGFLFWLRHVACRILIPRPGIGPALPAVEARSPNHWTAREVPMPQIFEMSQFFLPLPTFDVINFFNAKNKANKQIKPQYTICLVKTSPAEKTTTSVLIDIKGQQRLVKWQL